MNTPKISIIIPIYNVEPFLSKALDSVLNQTLREIEVIAVNDGSTDNSAQICKSYAEKDSRIIFIDIENGGRSNARNVGHRYVSAKYVMYLDADDWMDLQACEVALKTIEEEQADMVFWQWHKEFLTYSMPIRSIFDKKTILEGSLSTYLLRRSLGLIGAELSKPTTTDALANVWGKIYRFNIIKDNNLHFIDAEEIGSEDSFFNFQVFYYLKKSVFLPEFYNHYRQDNPHSVTKNHKNTLMPRYLKLFRYMADVVADKGLDETFTTALNNRIALSTINFCLSITGPRNSSGFSEKYAAVRAILYHPLYIEAYRTLEVKYLPLHWKVFFTFAKWKWTPMVFVMAVLMQKLRRKD